MKRAIVPKKREALLTGIFVTMLSFICITINSCLSFLYAFHDVDDVQCFITVARCMLRGDVLYRDVYEHKGPLHYFLYYIGIGTTGGSTVGVYILEIMLFALFLYATYKTIKLFCKYEFLNYVITVGIGVWASVRHSFCSGGECEELTLPFVAIALYLAVKDYAREFFSEFWTEKEIEEKAEIDRKKPINAVISAGAIGFCFAMVFWSKYTITGVFAGYVLAVIIIGAVNKSLRYISRRALGFVIGTVIGSLPVILYFGIHGAFSDLWEVYFYNLIFKYSQNDYGQTDFLLNLKSMLRVWVVIAVIGIIAAPKSILKKEGKIYALLMTAVSLVGLSVGKVWGYVYEAVVPFGILTVIGGMGIVGRVLCFEKARRLLTDFCEKTRIRFLKELEEKQKLKERLNRIFVEKKGLTTIITVVLLLVYAAYFCYTVTPKAESIGADPNDFVVVRISNEIKSRVPSNPVILNFTSLDMGLYYLTGTYPPDKYFCRYNLFTPRELGYYEKYLETGKADFVVSYKEVDDLADYGYELCYMEESVPTMNDGMGLDTRSYYLYARDDLIK